MEALGINIGYLVMQILGITILTLILRGVAYKPILNTLEARKQRIAKGLEDSRLAAIARDNAESEARKIIEEANRRAATIRAEAVTAAEESRKTIEEQAREEARTIAAKAETDAAERRNQALADLRGQIAAIAIAAAGKLVGESLDEKRQHDLIANFFSKVPAGVSNLRGTNAEVTSALPLTESEKQAARQSIKADNINFKVDPAILGGLIVRVGDRVVDNSVAGQMSGLRESLR